MAWFNTKVRRAGFSLIEILFAVTIFALLTTGIVLLSISSLQREARLIVDHEAHAFLEEGMEAVRQIRDKDYLALTTGTHGLSLGTGGWSFNGTSDTIDSYFTREIEVQDVYRDGSGDIVTTGGTLDPLTKKVVARLSWNYRGVLPRSSTLEAYMTDWSSQEWMQTTCTEFLTGTYTDTVNQAAAGPPADNCVVNLELVEQQGEFFGSTDIGEHGNDVFVEGNYAYVATHKTNSGLAIVDISDLENPVTVASLNVGARGRYVTKSGNYLYMGVQKSNAGLKVIDVTSPSSPAVVASVNVGGYGNEPTVVGSTLYLGVNSGSNGLKIYDVSTPSSPSLDSSLDVGAEVIQVSVSGNYAYLGVNDDDAGFQIVDVSDTQNPSVTSTLDLGNEGSAVWLSLPLAYVGEETTTDSLNVIDVSSPTSPAVLTTLDLGEKVEDIAESGSYLYVSLDQVNPGLAVVNVSVPTSPVLAYTMDIGGKGTGVSVDEDSVYVGVDTANAGLVAVGQASSSLATSGQYVSSALDTGTATPRLNYLEWESTEAPGGSIQFQLRTASTSGGLSSATWVGPDGTNGTYYTVSPTAIVTDPAASGTQFIQFKLFITSDGSTTPSVHSVSVNFSV